MKQFRHGQGVFAKIKRVKFAKILESAILFQSLRAIYDYFSRTVGVNDSVNHDGKDQSADGGLNPGRGEAFVSFW